MNNQPETIYQEGAKFALASPLEELRSYPSPDFHPNCHCAGQPMRAFYCTTGHLTEFQMAAPRLGAAIVFASEENKMNRRQRIAQHLCRQRRHTRGVANEDNMSSLSHLRKNLARLGEPFQGELMTCVLCGAKHRSQPLASSGWRALDGDKRWRRYACPQCQPADPENASSDQ